MLSFIPKKIRVCEIARAKIPEIRVLDVLESTNKGASERVTSNLLKEKSNPPMFSKIDEEIINKDEQITSHGKIRWK